MIDVMKEIEAIGKTSFNQGQRYNFRSIDSVYNSLHPVLAKCGVVTIPRVLERLEETYTNDKGTRMIRVVLRTEFDFLSGDGSKITVGPVFGEGNDSADKATNKAMSACHKYALLQTFCIPTEEEKDADFETPKISNEYKKQEPQKPMNYAPQTKAQAEGKELTQVQVQQFYDLFSKTGWSNDKMAELITEKCGEVKKVVAMTKDEWTIITSYMKAEIERKAQNETKA